MLIGFQGQLQLVDAPDPALHTMHDKRTPTSAPWQESHARIAQAGMDVPFDFAPATLLSANTSNLAAF